MTGQFPPDERLGHAVGDGDRAFVRLGDDVQRGAEMLHRDGAGLFGDLFGDRANVFD